MKQLNKGTQETMKLKITLKNDYSSIEKLYAELLDIDLKFIQDRINEGYTMKVEVIQ